ncbi:MAG: response regulator [Proteobacteria bacterium]|nr:response regulator [Pseudomonadota bacterium]MBU1386721.1 response regulator [Pseudomonadota bacterium]MBU1544369.1 response regulator [Pseudomonadota bacterium]MBU2481747.1 response regulator [Pseudomonadota bacterium]
MNILIADDEKEFNETLSQRLEVRDISVTSVYSGKSAVAMAEKIDFDVIILDVLMPEVTGLDALKKIKNTKPLTPIIMLTGAATVENAIQGMKLGAFDFLMKPADIELLMEKIHTAHQFKQAHEERIRKAEIENILQTHGW